MRILLYGINFSPELTGVGKYTGELAQWLAARGHEVQVVCAPPYYPQWHIQDNYRNRYETRQENGVAVYRCPLYVPRRVTTLKRLFHLLSFSFSSLPVLVTRLLKWRPQLLFAVAPPLLCVPNALFFGRLCGAKVWLHIQDYEVDAALELGLLPSPWLKRCLAAAERFLLSRFDRISTISDAMLEHLQTKNIPRAKRVLFCNWVDTRLIYPLTEPSPFRAQLGAREDQTLVLYAGNMGRKQGLETVIEAARLLRDDPSILFVLSGEGSMKPQLMELAGDLKNVRFLSLQPVERLNELLNAADIHVLIQRKEGTHCFMPSKLTAMLSSGKTVVASVPLDSEAAAILRGAGIAIPPENPKLLAQTLAIVSRQPERRETLGACARALALRCWEKEEVLSSFERRLCEALEEPPPALIGDARGRL